MHVLLTGHTGFKGAWLVLLLRERGHTVSGFALDPLAGSLFERAGLSALMESDIRADIRDADAVERAVQSTRPDVVMHLAAQPLVRESYRDPRTTFETNVGGTLNVLQAVSRCESVRAQLIVTTDKVYRNVNRVEGYREDEPLGGDDPYSSSKAMADLLTHSWTASFASPPTSVVRAGNVIGGGDVSAERLMTDLMASFAAGVPAKLRYPDAVRPWQHVLDCLNGYLLIVDNLLAGKATGAWNIGPGEESFVTVGDLATFAAEAWGSSASWEVADGEHVSEARLLALDASQLRDRLGWANKLPYPECVQWTVDWHRDVEAGADPAARAIEQIVAFERRP